MGLFDRFTGGGGGGGGSDNDNGGGGLRDSASDTIGGLWGGAKDTADRAGQSVSDGIDTTSNAARDVAERTEKTVRNTADSAGDTGREAAGVVTGDTSLATAANSAGETVMNVATGGEAREWRDEVRQQEGDWQEVRDRAQESFDQGGIVGNAAGANEVVKFGLDNMLDSPRGINVQDAGTDVGKFVTGSDDKDELARKVSSGYEDLSGGIGSIDERLGVEGTTTANVVGTGFEWFVEDPAKAGVTAATGIDPESGDTEARAEPVDLVDYAFLGGGKAIKGASKLGSRGARALSKTDEAASTTAKAADNTASASDNVASGADDAASSGGGGLRETAAAGVVGAAAVLGGPKAARSMSKFSWLDDALKTGASGADEAAAGADEVTQGIDSGSLDTIDNFDGLPSSVGTGEDAFRFTEDLSDTTSVMDEGASAVDEGGSATSIDSVLDMQRGSDDTFRLADEGAQAGDDAASNLPTTFDEVGTAVDDTADRLAATFDETFRLGDEAASGADETTSFFTRTADNLSAGADDFVSTADEWFSGADEGASTMDEGGSLLDEGGSATDDGASTLSTADEGGSLIDDMTSSVSGIDDITGAVGRWWGRRGWTFKLGAGILGLSVADDLFGIPFIPDSGDRRDPGPQGRERYRAEPVTSYEQTGASLYEIQQGTDSTEWQSMGYSIVIGRDEEGTFVSAGQVAVVGSNGRPVALDPVAGEGDNAVPQARFSTRGQADDAHAAFLAWLQDEFGGSGDEGNTPEPDEAPGLDGSLSVPSKVTQGEPFTADWSASLSGEAQEMSARILLAIATPQGLVPVAESDFTLGGPTTSQSGTFEAPSGWPAVAPGDYDVHAVIQQNGEIAGAVASDSTTVVAADGGDKTEEGSAWGDPELVQELPMGWYLYAQVKEDGSQETRFMVVGVREDEVYIYLHGDGRARTEPFFFPTAEDAAAAFRTYMERDPGANERPSEGASRPDGSRIKKDAAAADEQGAMGLLNSAISAATNNPVLFAGGTAATLVVGYYLYTNGYLDKVKL